MMKENILKTSKYVLLSITVVVVFILLFRQCSGNKSTREPSTDSSLLKTNVKRLVVEKGKKTASNEKIHFVESQKKIDSVQTSVDEKKVNSKATKKGHASKLQMKKPYYPFVQKESQVNSSTQFNEDIEEKGKPKIEDILKNDLKRLTEKVNVLDKKVKALLEKMRLFYEEKKNRILAEELVKKKKEVNPTRIMETLKDDDGLIYRYPTHVVTGGFSTYERWTGYGFQATYAYRINKFVSLGAQGNGYVKMGKYEGDRDSFMGLRANFHIFPLFVKNSRFDLYVSGTAGFGLDDSSETFEPMWCFGTSYDFCKRWGVFVEAGTIGVMGVRLTF